MESPSPFIRTTYPRVAVEVVHADDKYPGVSQGNSQGSRDPWAAIEIL